MKYVVVCYVDAIPFFTLEFSNKEEAYKYANETDEECYFDSVKVYEVEELCDKR